MKTVFSNKKILHLVFLLLTLLFVNTTFAQKTWDGGASTTNWGDANNWNPNGVPTSSDAVTLTQGQSVVVNISNAACSSLVLSPTGSGTAALSFNASSQLTVSGTVSLGNSGNNNRIGSITMTNGGKLICAGFTLANVGANVFTPGTGSVDLTATNTLPATIFTSFNNLTISGGKTSTGVGLTITSLSVKSAAEFALAHAVTANSLSLEGGALTGALVSGASTLTLGGDVTVTDNTGGTAGAVISCPVNLSATRTFTVADDGTSANDLTISSVISGTAFGVTKAGAGTLYLSGLNTYTGAVAINAGTLLANTVANASTTSSLGTGAGTAAISIGASGTLAYNGIGHSSSRGIILTGSGATIDASGTGGLTLSGGITGNTFNVVLTGTGIGTQSGVINTTTGTVTKNGTGTWVLSGTNTFTGATNVNAGTLNIQNAQGTGTTAGGVTVASGATLQLQGAIAVGAEALSLAGGGVDGNAAFDNVSGNNSWSGAITLAADATIRNQLNNLTISGTVALAGRQLTLGGTSTGGSISGVISGAGSGVSAIRKVTAGTWSLSGANTYTGNILIQLGTLTVGNASALGANTNNLSISSGAVANLSSSETVGSLTLDVLGTQNGTWGSGTSSATFKDDTYFTSTGILTVSTDTRTTPTTVTPIIGSYTFTGSAQGPNTATNTGSGTSYTYSYVGTGGTIYTASATPPTNAGTYTVTTTVAANRNYLSASSTATAFTIGVATPTVTVTVGSYTFSGSPQGPNSATNTGTGTSYTYSYVGTGATSYAVSATPPTNVGTYTVTATVAAAGNFGAASSTATAFTIGLATPTVTVTVGSYTFSGSPQGPNSATNTGTGTSYTYSYVGTGATSYAASATPPTNVGTYTVTATVAANGNFGSASSTATAFTIGLATPTVTPTIGIYTYTGSAQGPNTATNTGTGTSYTYSYAGVNPTVYGPSATRPTNAGSYTVTASVAAKGNYTAATSSAIAFTINLKSLTIAGVTVSNKIYDRTNTASLDTASATLVGVVSPDVVTLNSTGASGTFASANAGVGIAVTTGGFSLGGTNAGNYTLTQPTGLTATISPRPITLSGSRVYDNTDVAAATDLTITNNLDGANLTLSGSGSISLEDVGTRSISAASLPARVQFATANTGGNPATSCIATFSSLPTNGNTLIAVITTRNTAANTVSSITQTGATWTRATQGVNANGTTTEIWYAPARTTVGASVTVTLNTVSVRTSLVVMEYSGILALNPLDSVNNATGNSATATTNSITTTQANELLIAGVGLVNSAYSLGSITNSFSTVAVAATTNGTSSNNSETIALERIVTAAGTYSAGGTISTSSQWSAAIASFKAVIPSGNAFVLGGSAASNYTLAGLTGTMEITPKNVTVNGVVASNKEYDGTTIASLNTDLSSLSGVISSDVVSLNSSNATGTFASANVGTGIAVTASGLSLTGANAGNYSVTQPTGLSANITAKGITIYANNINKCLGSTLTFAGNEFTTSSQESGLTISGVTLTSTGATSSAALGTYTIAASNATGTGLGNYAINYVSGTLTVMSSPATTGVSICPGGSGVLTSSVTCISASILGGVKNPGAVVNSTAIGTDAWSNPSNAMTNNGATAIVTLSDSSKRSNYLVSSNHAFAIPSNAIIQGIKVVINKYASNFVTFTRFRDNEVKLVKAGAVVGDNKANVGVDWPQTAQDFTYGSVNDLWGSTWTAADINNANFGVALSALSATNPIIPIPYTGEVDSITIEVAYSLPGTLNWFTASSGGSAIGSGSSFNPVGVAGSSLTNTNTPGTTTFYAECSSLPGCRTATDFVITPNPTAPTAINNTKTYTGIANTTSISATPQASQTIDWYQDATGGSPLLSGSTTYIPTAVNAGTYTFYAAARATSLGCTSTTRTPVTLTITKAPLTVTANNQSVSFKTAVASVLSAGTYTASGFVNGETASVISGTVTYTTTYTATTNAGTAGVTITPNISGLTAANYSFIAVANGTITIDNATPIVTPIIGSYTYTGLPQGPNTATNTGTGATYTYSYVGVSGTVYAASATPPRAVGSYTVTATVAADGNYTAASSVPTAFTIGKAVVTITANNQGVSYGVSVASVTGAGTYTATGFVNGETDSVISGAATYTTSYTTTTAIGTAGVTITPNVSGLSAANYSFVGANGTIDINTKITPTISVTVGTYTYTGLPQGPNTATNSGTGSTYSYSYSGTGSTVYGPSANLPTNAGSYVVKATVAPSADGVYNAVTSAEIAFAIDKAALTLKASNTNKTYGTVRNATVSGSTAYTITSGSLKNGETIGSVTLSYGIGAIAATDAVGNTSIITPSAAVGGTFSINNYTITYTTGILTVTPLAITVSAIGPSKVYGTALTTGTSASNFTVTGTLPSGQAITSVTLTPNANGLSATTAAGTTYTVTPSLATGTGGFLASNYSITYVVYLGVVATKSLTITANGVSKVYGDVIATPETGSTSFTASGLVGSETVGSVTLNYGTGAAATSVVGTYANAVVPSAATGGTFTAANYAITYVGGAITVTKAALTVTAQDQSKCFGANVVFFGDEFLSAGLKNSDIVTTVSLSSTASATATVAGIYPITPSAAVGTGLDNYTITYVNGTFTVISTPAPSLSVTPATATVCSGTAVAIAATISGGSPNKVFTGVNNTRVNIPNNSSNSVSQFATSTISLSDATSATLSSTSVISVQFSISHTSVQELDVYLVSPSGTRGMLLTANNGGSGNNYTNTIISTSATNVIGSTGNNSAPFTGTYAPEGSITTVPATNTQNAFNSASYSTANIGSLALNGATINGTWSLKVFDTYGATVGTLDNWTLTITNPGVYTSTLVGPNANETINYSGANNQNTAITMTPPAGVNNFYVETTDAIGCSNISSAIVTTVNTAPAITVQPTAPAAVCSANGTRTISVTATGAGLTYSWRKAGVAVTNGAVISGQGTAALTFTNPVAADAGSYDVLISGTCSPTVTSSAVTLTVNPNNTVSLSSAVGTNAQTRCINTAINNITYATTGATGATFSGLPSGVTGAWAANVATISGTPSASGTFSYTVTLTGGCGIVTATGTIIVTPANTVTLSSAVGTNAQTPCINTAITNITYATTGATGATFSGLPAGVTGAWAANVVTINGTPSVTGTFNYTVTLTGGCGTVTTTGTITVNPNVTASVSIVSNDLDNAICSGTSVTFTATPTNGGVSPSYLWKLNGVNVGTNSATYTSTALTNNDQVNVVMTSNASCVTASPSTSNTVTMTVNPNLPASVSIAATATTICSGTSVTFTATPTNGGTTPSYQWKLNGTNVGTNSSTYATTTLANNDVVSVVMTSTAICATGSPATSNTVTMTVNPNLPASVSVGATATTICSGTSVTFTATPTNGGTTPSYQWKLNGVNVGTNSPTYTSTTLANGNTVSVVMTSNATPCLTSSPATSNTVTMTVNPNLPASVSIGATATTICSGTSVTFTATPTNGGTTPSYQWKVNGTNVGTNSATYTSTTLVNNDAVTVVMTSNATPCLTSSPATSNTVTMTVNPNLPASVSVGATATTICSGTSVTFTATPTNGGTTPSYQWKLNGVNVGTNSPTYTSTTLANGNTVSVVMTSNATPCLTSSPATSNTVTMTVNPNLPASVSVGATATTICSGTSVTFTATPTNGGTTPTYQWKVNGVNVGTNSATYTSTTLVNNDAVTVVMTSNATPCLTSSPATSNTVTMTVNPNLPASVSIGATATTICSGTSVTFTATPTNGGTTPSYQWKVNGVNVGTNSATYTSTTLVNNDAVTVVMTSNATPCLTSSPATSNTVTMTVNPISVAGTVSSDQTITTGTAPSTISLTGGVGSIQWQSSTNNVHFTDIVGATSATLAGATIGTLSTTTYFRAIVTSGACSSVTSSTVTVTVQAAFQVGTLSTTQQTICSGTTPSDISVVGSIGAIQWQISKDNVTFTDIPGATSAVLSGASMGVLSTTTYFKCIVTRGQSQTGTAGTVTISMGGSTTWNGTSWSNGAPTSITSAIISGNYNVAANINACSLTVNNNAIVIIPSGYNVTLNNALTVANGSSFTLENNANLLQQGTTNTNSGAIVVKRNSSPLMRLDYTLWSSPVANQNVLSFSPSTMSNRFYVYDSPTNFYTPIVPSTTLFSAGKGLLIRVPNTHPTTPTIWTGKFTGVPNNGDYTYDMYYNRPTAQSPKLLYNLVGNPYPSPISMSRFVADNSDVITGTLYFWRETNGNLYNNSYCAWAGGTFVSNYESQVVNPNGIIQTGQGFFVEAKSASKVVFKNSQREANTANQFFRTSAEEERNTIWLNAKSAAGAFAQMAVGYITGATQGVDLFDGKSFGGGPIALSSVLEDANYVIQGRALPFDDSDEVPLGFKTKTAGEYSISIDHVIGLFASNQDIFIKDNLTNTVQNLKVGPYTFSCEVGEFNSRFSLVFKTATTLGTADFQSDANITVVFTNNDNMINLKNKDLGSRVLSVSLYNLVGQVISTWDMKNENQQSMQLQVRDLATGTYIVKVMTTKGSISKKIIIKNAKMALIRKKVEKELPKERSILADED